MDQIILEIFWKALPKAILFSLLFFFLGLALGVVTLVWLHKKELLKRETPALKIINYIYYLYIPLLFGLTLLVVSLAYNVKRFTYDIVEVALQEAKKETLPDFERYVGQEIEKITGKPPLSNEEIVDGYLKRNAARANNSVTRLILKKALDYSLGKGKERDKKLAKIKKTGGKFLANQVYSVVENLIKQEIKKWYTILLILVGIIFILAILIPVIEIYISFRMRLRKENKQEIPPKADAF